MPDAAAVADAGNAATAPQENGAERGRTQERGVGVDASCRKTVRMVSLHRVCIFFVTFAL